VRQGLERQHELRLQEANQRVTMLRQQIEGVHSEAQNILTGRRPQFESGISAAELQFDVLCLSVLTERQHALEQQLVEAEALRHTRSEEFLQARRQREVIDTLRHHQLQDCQQAEARQDQRRLDDLFLLRRAYLRRS
jgi:flagellar export protein FliJ